MLLKILVGLLISYGLYLYKYQQQKVLSENVDKQIVHSKWEPPNVEIPQPPSMSTLHVYEMAAVCSDKTLCSKIGSTIMQNGGNAIDTAIATLLCNGLVTMQSMGLGGGVIINYYSQEKKEAISIIGRERSPLKLNKEAFKALHNSSSLALSALAIAVPGELAAYQEAHIRYGSLAWHKLVKPTLDLCFEGYQLTRHQRDALYLNEQMIRKNKLLKTMFVDPISNEFFQEGWLLKVPLELCNTYRLLMEEGPSTFYNGSLASLIVQDLTDMGSSISLEDLRGFKAVVQDSLVVDLKPYNLFVPGPPGSGHVVGFIMKILQKFQHEYSLAKNLSAKESHRIIEALKFGFVKRWEYDAEIDEEILKNLTSSKQFNNLAKLIEDLKTFENPQHYGAQGNLKTRPDYGTAQISVLAPNGDAVSATSSLNYYFGSGRMGLRSGILFNNAISDFNIKDFENYFNLPNIPTVNQIKPQKQPMSSMVPLIVTNQKSSKVRLVVGAAGGSRIISSLVQILIRILWLQQNIKVAIDAPRFHHQLVPNVLQYEFGILREIIEDLEAKGHITERERRKSTAVCGVEIVNDAVVLANADYRKEGGVHGF